MNTRVPQSQDELAEHLEDQIQFLEASANAYDAGFSGEAKRLAVTLRILLHDRGQSKSLLGQLGKKTLPFYDTSRPEVSPGPLAFAYAGLVMWSIPEGGAIPEVVPMLDDELGGEPRLVEFDAWWNAVISKDTEGRAFTRKDIVLSVADQDGGAHVDAALNEAYAKLSRQNTLGWVVSRGLDSQPVRNPERMMIRQIAHEVLKTLKPGYTKLRPHRPELLMGEVFTREVPDPPAVTPTYARVGPNQPCPCGSGKKYKRCHGAGPVHPGLRGRSRS